MQFPYRTTLKLNISFFALPTSRCKLLRSYYMSNGPAGHQLGVQIRGSHMKQSFTQKHTIPLFPFIDSRLIQSKPDIAYIP